MIVIGVILLLAAAVVGAVGVATNMGSAAALTSTFSIFGWHLTGTTGRLFLSGLIVGAIGMLGLALLLSGSVRRNRAAREYKRSQRAERDRRKEEQAKTTTQGGGDHVPEQKAPADHPTDQPTEQRTDRSDT